MPNFSQKCPTKLLEFCCELCANATYADISQKHNTENFRHIQITALFECPI